MEDKVILEDISPLILAPKIHHGENIAKMRELFDYTQKDLAEKLKWRQQKVSDLELVPTIDDEILLEVANVFGISAQKLKYSNVKESAINVFKDNNISSGGMLCGEGTQTFYQNDIDTILKLNDKLHSKEREVLETKIELETRSHEITKRELAIIQKELELLKK